MEDFSSSLETRCIDVLELAGTDTQIKRAIFGRSCFMYYLDRIQDYISVVFKSDFHLDWNYTNRNCFASIYSFIVKLFGNKKIGKVDCLTYYFDKVAQIYEAINLNPDNQDNFEKAFVFLDPFVDAFPKELNGCRTFRGNEMTMAGFLVFLAPLLSSQDVDRLLDDATKIFAKTITYFQGLHTEQYKQALANLVTFNATNQFTDFFLPELKDDFTILLQIVFGDKYRYVRLEKEDDKHFSFNLDLSVRIGKPVYQFCGQILDEGDRFTVVYDTIKSKCEFEFNEDSLKVSFMKSALTQIITFSQRTPSCMFPIAICLHWPNAIVDESFLRSSSSGLMDLQYGYFWLYDRDRDENVSIPCGKVVTCLSKALLLTDDRIKENKKLTSSLKIHQKILYLVERAGLIRLDTAFDNQHSLDLIDEKGNIINYDFDKLATDLLDSFILLKKYGDYNNVFVHSTMRGIFGYIVYLLSYQYTDALITSRRSLDPLSQTDEDWHKSLMECFYRTSNYMESIEFSKLVFKKIVDNGMYIDAFMFSGSDYYFSQPTPTRYFYKLTVISIKSKDKNIFIKGKDTGLKEFCFFSVNPMAEDVNSIAGPNGEPLTKVGEEVLNAFMSKISFVL